MQVIWTRRSSLLGKLHSLVAHQSCISHNLSQPHHTWISPQLPQFSPGQQSSQLSPLHAFPLVTTTTLDLRLASTARAGIRLIPSSSDRSICSNHPLLYQYSRIKQTERRYSTTMSTHPESVVAADSRKPLSLAARVEASKRLAAYKAVEDHFDPSYRYIGIGSGSTVVYVVEAIAAKGRAITSRMLFVPTGDQSKQLIIEAGLPIGSIDSLPPVLAQTPAHDKSEAAALAVSTGMQDLALKGKRESLDVAFDGADEIDEDLNCIKGGGACLFQEKLVATSAKKFICVADYRKLVPRLLTNWKTIPIEIAPFAAPTIKRILITLGAPDPKIRQGGSAKAGPVVTDNGMWIIDADFPTLKIPSDLKDGDLGDGTNGTWEVHALGRRLKRTVGILEVGLFHGRNGLQVAAAGEEGGGQKPVAAYFGMENGEVEIRVAKDIESRLSRA